MKSEKISPDLRPPPNPGERRLKDALARRRQARDRDPTPYDDTWGWWIQRRLERLENGQKWLIRLAAGILVAEILRTFLSL